MLFLLCLACVLWGWAGFKTWAFILTDLMDERDRLNVVFAFFGGLLWPVTYFLLIIVLIVGIFLGQSIGTSWLVIKQFWRM